MRIGIVSAAVPLREDDATRIGERLEEALHQAGHDVELILLPFSEVPGAQLVQRVAYRAMEFAQHYDLVVTLGTPAEVVRHPRKVAWLVGDPLAGEGRLLHRALADACARASLTGLREARRVLAVSAAVAGCLRAAGLQVDVVLPGDLDGAMREVLA